MHPGRDCARAERSPTGEAARDANCRRWREKAQICAPSLLKCKLPSLPAPHGLLRRSRTRTNGGGRGPGAGGRQGPRRAADAVADAACRGRREAQIRRPPRPGPARRRGPAAVCLPWPGRGAAPRRRRRGPSSGPVEGAARGRRDRARRPPWRGGREIEKGPTAEREWRMARRG